MCVRGVSTQSDVPTVALRRRGHFMFIKVEHKCPGITGKHRSSGERGPRRADDVRSACYSS